MTAPELSRLLLLVPLVCSCNAYDQDKLGTSPVVAGNAAARSRIGDDPDASEIVAVSCGNGRLDPGEHCDISISEGAAGACPDRCEPSADRCIERELSGSGCRVQCVESRITKPSAGDACCPAGTSAADDADCGRCGDRMIGPAETCDPPSSCPTPESCAAFAARCVRTRFAGSAEQCSARCELIGEQISDCRAGDACCPPGCNSDSDGDCSARCGDGVVDAESGETCEADDTARGCDTDCDDRNACTRDVRSGSAANCNVSCAHIPISSPQDGDGCCPAQANAENDEDCQPRCGNRVLEDGEACDGSEGCDSDCRWTATTGAAPPTRELETRCADLSDDPCARCGCLRCTEVRDACRNSATAERNDQCRTVVDCGVKNRCIGECTGQLGCFGHHCWFGDGYPTASEGPCVDRIRTAAGGATESSAISAASHDAAFALYYAERYAACLKALCTTECSL